MTEQRNVIHFRCECGVSFDSKREVARASIRIKSNRLPSVRFFFLDGTVLLRPGRDVKATCYGCVEGR